MLDFYTIDSDYLDFLRQFDSRIPENRYKTHEKFFCGIVLNINNCDYFAPVSHYNKPQRTNFAIYDKDNSKILSTVRFNYMFPALQAVVHKLIIKDVYKTDSRYAILVAKEYDYCSKHEDHLRKRALSVY
ncbi:MAG: type III toxin-antitoxin system ToxN/AbiQ family toxin, partial [Pyramidobacter sp.]|nr:type III toxin-antitoxin system ToxN/AbiQ family toxin [Pyramidobacter sp.]